MIDLIDHQKIHGTVSMVQLEAELWDITPLNARMASSSVRGWTRYGTEAVLLTVLIEPLIPNPL